MMTLFAAVELLICKYERHPVGSGRYVAESSGKAVEILLLPRGRSIPVKKRNDLNVNSRFVGFPNSAVSPQDDATQKAKVPFRTGL